VIRIDLEGLRKAGYEIPSPTKVPAQFGQPGGGWQYFFEYMIPRDFITVLPQ
jgi:hypothetical protein